jgi:hypothetical protein
MSFKISWKAHIAYFGIRALIIMVLWDTANMLVHEGLHSIPYTMFGDRSTYKLRRIYDYAMETSEKPIERTRFLVVLLTCL